MRFVDFELIYGSAWPDEQCNLFKYYAKSFGCRLADISEPVPRDIQQLMQRDALPLRTGLMLSFSVNGVYLALSEQADLTGFLGKGDLHRYPTTCPRLGPAYSWYENYEWLHVSHWYNLAPEPRLGEPWSADLKVVHFGEASADPKSDGS